uniref:DH domain-containing protein n=1 Tax=Haemonchus placei TaxID=6290 RepID=A0A0N4WT49_HAEPC
LYRQRVRCSCKLPPISSACGIFHCSHGSGKVSLEHVPPSLLGGPHQSKNSPLWARFDLFSKDEYTSWHDKYRHEKLSSKVVKKQDAIFELILIEKSHCAHLAFLQQGYRNRLLQENILLEADLNRLIPDVLDALLVFHLNLLDRLTARQRESDEVETISDILAEELSDEGKHIGIAVNAYTTFGSSKERSEKMFESLMAKNARFAEFIRTSSQDPLYRRYEFKSTMTRVISRPAKYGLLVETILKNEYNKFTKESELTQKALLAAKRFAMKIDNNLLVAQMAQRWDDVRSHFDHSSHTNLYLVDKEKPSGVVRITFTVIKFVISVFMVLFDDILVCLQRRSNQKYVFIQQQSVFPVSGLILRPADRSASVMIISGAITKPALLEVDFNSKADRTKWIKTLETAIHSAPVKGWSNICYRGAARQLEIERQLQVKRQKEAEDAWLRKLDEMFEQRNSQERIIQDYVMSLMKFFDELRAHLHTLPLKSRPDIADRIREAVRQHCRELRIRRTAPLNRSWLIENACVARESELWSFIDVTAEMALDGTPDSDGGGSSSDSSGSGRRPRRIHTFHGTTGPSSGHGASTSSTKGSGYLANHSVASSVSNLARIELSALANRSMRCNRLYIVV